MLLYKYSTSTFFISTIYLQDFYITYNETITYRSKKFIYRYFLFKADIFINK
jgi:hypothetical protein